VQRTEAFSEGICVGEAGERQAAKDAAGAERGFRLRNVGRSVSRGVERRGEELLTAVTKIFLNLGDFCLELS
jgi:hypothetical protein